MGLEMYIIRKGHVAVVGKHNQLLSVMGPGDNFGEIALLTQVWIGVWTLRVLGVVVRAIPICGCRGDLWLPG